MPGGSFLYRLALSHLLNILNIPVGPQRDRLFLDRELVDQLEINESRPRAVRAVFHNILFDRMRNIRAAPRQQQPPPLAIQQQSRSIDSSHDNNNAGSQEDVGAPSRRFAGSASSSIASSSRVPPLLPVIGETSARRLMDDDMISPDASPIMNRDLADEEDDRYADDDVASPVIAAPPPPTQSFRTGPFSPLLIPLATAPGFSRPPQDPPRAVITSPTDSEISGSGLLSPPVDSPSIYSPNPLSRSTSHHQLNGSTSSSHSGPALVPLASPGAPTTPLPSLPPTLSSFNNEGPALSELTMEDYERRQSQTAQIEGSSPTQYDAEVRNRDGFEERERRMRDITPTPARLNPVPARSEGARSISDMEKTPRAEPASYNGAAAPALDLSRSRSDEGAASGPSAIEPTRNSTYDLEEENGIHSDVRLVLSPSFDCVHCTNMGGFGQTIASRRSQLCRTRWIGAIGFVRDFITSHPVAFVFDEQSRCSRHSRTYRHWSTGSNAKGNSWFSSATVSFLLLCTRIVYDRFFVD